MSHAFAGVYKEMCLQVIQHKYECELQGARQHLEVRSTHTHCLHPVDSVTLQLTEKTLSQSERSLLLDAMRTELLEKIRRLEEDRQNVDFFRSSSGTRTL